jgi:hypothetical protein
MAFIDSMKTTVYSFDVTGLRGQALVDATTANERVVSRAIKNFSDTCKKNEVKFIDPDFGPTDGSGSSSSGNAEEGGSSEATANDEYGAMSLYGNPPKAPQGGAYPKAEKLRWERPFYANGDDDFSDNEDEGGEDEGGEDVEDDEFDDEFDEDSSSDSR